MPPARGEGLFLPGVSCCLASGLLRASVVSPSGGCVWFLGGPCVTDPGILALIDGHTGREFRGGTEHSATHLHEMNLSLDAFLPPRIGAPRLQGRVEPAGALVWLAVSPA